MIEITTSNSTNVNPRSPPWLENRGRTGFPCPRRTILEQASAMAKFLDQMNTARRTATPTNFRH